MFTFVIFSTLICAGLTNPVLRPQCRAGVCDDRPECPKTTCRCVYPSRVDCAVYYQCVQGKPLQYRCSPGLLFNEDTLTCDYDFNVNCTQGTTVGSSSPTPEIPRTTTSTSPGDDTTIEDIATTYQSSLASTDTTTEVGPTTKLATDDTREPFTEGTQTPSTFSTSVITASFETSAASETPVSSSLTPITELDTTEVSTATKGDTTDYEITDDDATTSFSSSIPDVPTDEVTTVSRTTNNEASTASVTSNIDARTSEVATDSETSDPEPFSETTDTDVSTYSETTGNKETTSGETTNNDVSTASQITANKETTNNDVSTDSQTTANKETTGGETTNNDVSTKSQTTANTETTNNDIPTDSQTTVNKETTVSETTYSSTDHETTTNKETTGGGTTNNDISTDAEVTTNKIITNNDVSTHSETTANEETTSIGTTNNEETTSIGTTNNDVPTNSETTANKEKTVSETTNNNTSTDSETSNDYSTTTSKPTSNDVSTKSKIVSSRPTDNDVTISITTTDTVTNENTPTENPTTDSTTSKKEFTEASTTENIQEPKSSSSAVVTTKETTGPDFKNFTCPSRFGLFPDPSSCFQFYQCSQWTPYHKKCPSNLHFNPSLQVCDWPYEAGCVSEIVSSTPVEKIITSPPPETNISSTSVPERTTTELVNSTSCDCDSCDLPLPNNCTSYILCIDRTVIPITCVEGLYYNPYTGTCDLMGNVQCESNVHCPRPTGRFPYPHSCQHFMECALDQMTVRKCPEEMVYDKDGQDCIWGESCQEVNTTETPLITTDNTVTRDTYPSSKTTESIFASSTSSTSNITETSTSNEYSTEDIITRTETTTDKRNQTETTTNGTDVSNSLVSDSTIVTESINFSTNTPSETTGYKSSPVTSSIPSSSTPNVSTIVPSTTDASTDTPLDTSTVTSTDVSTVVSNKTNMYTETTLNISTVTSTPTKPTTVVANKTNTPTETPSDTSTLTTTSPDFSTDVPITTDKPTETPLEPSTIASTPIDFSTDVAITTAKSTETPLEPSTITSSAPTDVNTVVTNNTDPPTETPLEPSTITSTSPDVTTVTVETVTPTGLTLESTITSSPDVSITDTSNTNYPTDSDVTTGSPSDTSTNGSFPTEISTSINTSPYPSSSTQNESTTDYPSTSTSDTNGDKISSTATSNESDSTVTPKGATNAANSTRYTTATPDGLSTQTSTETVTTVCPQAFKCPTRFGLFPDPNSCFRFLHCSHWIPYQKLCPSELHFNQVLQVCDWPYRAGCNLTTTTCDEEISPTPEKTTTPQEKNTSATFTMKTTVSDTKSSTLEQPTTNSSISSDFKCPSRFGLFPDPMSCFHFYQCSHWTTFRKLCPSNLHFNPELLVCDWPYKAGCGHSVTTPPPPSHDETPVHNNQTCDCECCFLPDTTDCSKYLLCLDGVPHSGRCADGLLFHRLSGNCDVAGRVDDCQETALPQCDGEDGFYGNEGECSMFYRCVDGEAFVEKCPKGLHFRTVDRKCVEPCQAGCDRSLDCGSESKPNGQQTVCLQGDGLYPAEDDCSSFYQCSGGVRHIVPCPPGLHFNPDYDVCESPCDAGCDPLLRCSTTRSNPELNCTCENCLLPDPTDCSAFHLCKNNRPTIGYCPSGQLFDASTGRCSDEKDVKCELNGDPAMCPRPYGSFSYPGDCKKFVHCVESVAHVRNCERGSEFDTDIGSCTSSKGNCGAVPQDPVCRSPTGQFSHPSNCSLFYQCENGVSYLKSCTPPLVFNSLEEVCDWPENYPCMDGPTPGKSSRISAPVDNKSTTKALLECRAVPGVTCPCACRVPTYDECSSFYHCRADGSACKRFCPDGLYFNKRTMVCDLPENVECRDFFFSTTKR